MGKQLLLVMAILFAGSCSLSAKWRGTDDFVAHLRCGMSEEDVTELAASYPGLHIRRTESSQLGEMAAFKKNTRISLEFGDSGLVRTGVSWNDGILSAKYASMINLCTGTRSIWLVIHTPNELRAAVIFVNDKEVSKITASAVSTIDFPVGTHKIRVEKCGYEPWEAALSFSQEGSGYQHIVVPAPIKTADSTLCDP